MTEKNASKEPHRRSSLRKIFAIQLSGFVIIVIAVFLMVFLSSQKSIGTSTKSSQPSEFPITSATSISLPSSEIPSPSDQGDANQVGNNSIGGPPPGMVRCMQAFNIAHAQITQQHEDLKSAQNSTLQQIWQVNAEWVATGGASQGNGLPTPEFQARLDALQAQYDNEINTMRYLEQQLGTMQPKDFNCE